MSDEPQMLRSADRVVEVLKAQGIKYVFGVPGAKIDGVFDALVESDLTVIPCRHEQNAAFMAAAVGRLTETPGVAIVTSGPGTSNLATGLVTATSEGDPMVVICGAVPRADRLKATHQSMDAAGLLSTVTKYTGEVNSADNVAAALTNAFRQAAVRPRGAAAVVLPSDVQAEKTAASITRKLPIPKLGPAPTESVEQIAQLIREAEYPVILAGARSADRRGTEALQGLLRATELPVVETFQAAGVVSRDLEDHFLGRVGLFRNQPGDIVLNHADLVLAIGYDQIEYDAHLWNKDINRKVIHLDEVELSIDSSYQPHLEIRGDIPTTLEALTPLLADLHMKPVARKKLDFQLERLNTVELPTGGESDNGMDPLMVVQTLREVLPDETIVASDIGSFQIYMARYFRTDLPRTLLFSNGQQTLGVGLPWAMAACLVSPEDTPVVSVSGDGGFLYSATELETAVRLNMNLTHVIFNDHSYNMVAFQQDLKYGRPSCVDLGDYDVVKYAESFGAHGYNVESIEELASVLKKAMAEEGPSIINVPVDYANNATYLAGQLRNELLS